MATDFNQIVLNDDQRHPLTAAVDQTGIPWPEVFEKAIAPLAHKRENGFKNGSMETPYDILSRHGLIGCVEGTPPDLSTNKGHLSGYGKNG